MEVLEEESLPLPIREYLAERFPGKNYQFHRAKMELPSVYVPGLLTPPVEPTTVYAVTLVPFHEHGTYVFRMKNNKPELVAYMRDTGYNSMLGLQQ